MSWYVDSSVIIAAILQEASDIDFSKVFERSPVTSRLSRAEVLRRISKSDTDLIPRAKVLLQQCTSIDMSEVILKRAENYPPDITVKAADAIHLATAETISSMIRGIITFDKQMAKNAERLGLKVFSNS